MKVQTLAMARRLLSPLVVGIDDSEQSLKMREAFAADANG